MTASTEQAKARQTLHESDAAHAREVVGSSLVRTDGRPLSMSQLEEEAGPGSVVAQAPISALLHEAVRRGTPVAELKELVALYEHMEAREAQKLFAAALAQFQKLCPPIKKGSTAKITTSTGGEFKYTFAELDDIAAIVNPILAPLGLSYSWDMRLEKDLLTCTCTLRHSAGHAQPAVFACPTTTMNKVSDQQKVGGALTYAKRQSLVQVLGLTMTDDRDTDGADQKPISPEQLAELEAMFSKALESRPDEKKAERFRTRFFTYMGVEFLAEIPAADFKRAVSALRQTAEAPAAAAAAE